LAPFLWGRRADSADGSSSVRVSGPCLYCGEKREIICKVRAGTGRFLSSLRGLTLLRLTMLQTRGYASSQFGQQSTPLNKRHIEGRPPPQGRPSLFWRLAGLAPSRTFPNSRSLRDSTGDFPTGRWAIWLAFPGRRAAARRSPAQRLGVDARSHRVGNLSPCSSSTSGDAESTNFNSM